MYAEARKLVNFRATYIESIGSGKMIFDFLSNEMVFRICVHLKLSAQEECIRIFQL